jgi:hypothetical protein
MSGRRLPAIIPATLLALAPTMGFANPEPDCRALIAAQPADWPARWQQVRDHGASATTALIAELRINPEGPGAQAAVHLLGELRHAEAGPYLREILEDGTSLATEAALALGKFGDQSHTPTLRATVADSTKHVTTRAAAAAALVDLGHGKSIAAFLEAVFLAATPYGAAATRTHRLPRTKTRWAHERYMLIEALRRAHDGRTFGLDEDSSWPAMRDAARKMRTFLEG